MKLLETTHRHHKTASHSIFAGLLALAVTGCANVSLSRYGLPITKLRINHHVLRVEVAATAAARRRGLRYRKYMVLDGMLFVFTTPRYPAFWMKDTQLPLSIAFIDAGGKIDSVHRMAPRTLTVHQSKKPVLYALEVLQGTFSRLGIRPGNRVRGLDSLPADH